ncbi:ABC transporter permease [Amycolatopsis jejuensis]|uniref:ABC transporter permease n=1 Tax=Amycolatopsis jejuensis TaxID=330084 RepID=UPI000527D4E0|nr:ABC transporter permease [Amycolatopsis jejuensis]
MTGYLVRRVLQAFVVVVLVSMIVFALLHVLPGGPARAMLGPQASEEQVAQFVQANGYDQPLPVQYGKWLGQLLHGDLGYSYKLNQSVTSLLADRLPKTVLLTGVATLLAVLIAVPLGVFQAVRRNRFADYLLTGLAFIFYSTPAFFLGLVLILGFAVELHWFPAQAPQASSLLGVLSQPIGLFLPIATLTLVSVAHYSRYARSAIMDNLVEDYVRTARAKGAGEGRILFRHVLHNAFAPIVTILGLSLPGILSGTLITESVFNYPGMGLLFWTSAQIQDYPVLLGFSLIVGIATVTGSLLADLAYALLDPRVRYTRA